MKTRRSKLSGANTEDNSVEVDTSFSQISEPAFMTNCLSISLPNDLDIELLQSIIPTAPLLNPSADAVVSLYRFIIEQATLLDETNKDRDQARADASRLEVELDQALQDQDVHTNQLRTSLEEAHRELEVAKKEISALTTTRSDLEAKVSSLSNDRTSSSSETEMLRKQIAEVQNEKRNLVEVVSSLQEASAQREEDVTDLRSRLKQSRAELSTLQTELADARSNDVSNKFRVQTLEQELDLIRGENERNLAELNSQQESASADRRAKHAEIVRLQSQVDSLTQESASAASRLESLRKAHRAQELRLVETLDKVQSLQGELSQQTSAFRAEAETQKRLAELMDRRNEDSRRRVEEIEREWDSVLAKASTTENQLKDELAKERQRGDDLETRLDELKTVLERFGGPTEVISHQAPGSPLATPSRSGTPGTPAFYLSPTASLATKLQKSGRSYTEVYADYVRLGDEIKMLKEENRRLSSALAQILADIEERAPLIQSQRAEYVRVTEEISALALQLAQASSERDDFERAAREGSVAVKKAEEENGILQKQLTDLGRQVQGLLREIAIRDDPSLENLEYSNVPPADESDSDQVITSNLVLFTSLPHLQQQNQRLLRTARGLAAQWEERQATLEAQLSKEETEALAEASAAVRDMEEELQRQKVLVASHQKERDMFRSMLARQGKDVPEGSSSGAASQDPAVVNTDYRQMLDEQQMLFETFKNEMSIDSAKLKEDLLIAQREVGQQSASLAKANAQIEFLQERILISQNSADLQSQEISGLQKRNQQLQDALGKTEISSYHVLEEQREARSITERLRNQSASLLAENNFLKSFEERLQEENRNLLKEKAQLKDLVGNLQSIHAELERSSDGERRRTESQIKSLENQSNDLREQLNKEVENARHVFMQKDFEIKELHTRLESTVQDLFKSREAHSVAETSQSHLQTRVDDLLRQLDASNQKLSVYERPSTRAEGAASTPLSGASEEDRLRAEVAELSAALKVAETDLAKSREHVEQFKNISQANEEALESLNSTFEQYKADTERELVTTKGELQNRKDQFDAAQRDLEAAIKERADLAQQLEAQRIEFDNDKRTLEATITDLSTVEDRANSDQMSIREDLRRQADLARDAHEKYARELVAHAEAVKQVSHYKEQFLEAQAAARNNQTAAETASARAANIESNWAAQKAAMEKELEDVSNRCKDLTAQNSALHQHLETISSQAARIRRAAESTDAIDLALANGNGSADDDDALAELHSVLTFVRREKEIAELQLDLHKQENARLKSYGDHLAQTLESTRNLLKQEREEASRSVASAEQHTDLLEKINQLNLLRESNATLRMESEANLKAVQDLQAQLRQVKEELNPAKEQARMLKAEVEARIAQIHRLEEDNRRLKDRTEQILSKHHRVDPTEMQTLRDEIAALQEERDLLRTQKDEFEAQSAKMKDAAQAHKDAYSRLSAQSKTHLGNLNKEKDELRRGRAELEKRLEDSNSAHASEITSLYARISSLEAEKLLSDASLHDAQSKAVDAEQALTKASVGPTAGTDAQSEFASTIASLEAERDTLRAENKALRDQNVASEAEKDESRKAEEALKASRTNEQELRARNEKLYNDNKRFYTEMKTLREKVTALESEKKAADVAKQAQSAGEVSNAPPDVQELVERRVAEVTAEHERAQTEAIARAVTEATAKQKAEDDKNSVPRAELDALAEQHAAEVKSLESRLKEQYDAELKQAVDAAVASAPKEAVPSAEPSAESIEAAVTARLAEEKAKWEAEKPAVQPAPSASQNELRATIEKELAAKHQEAIENAKASVQRELEAKTKAKDAQLLKLRADLATAQQKLANATNPVASTSTSTTTSAIPKGPASQALNSGSALPAKPAAAGAVRGGIRGRGRGVARGGSHILASVNATTSAGSPTTPTSAGQTQILGAGAKRPRESEADSQQGHPSEGAKRLRGGPTIIRNRVAGPGQPPPKSPAASN